VYLYKLTIVINNRTYTCETISSSDFRPHPTPTPTPTSDKPRQKAGRATVITFCCTPTQTHIFVGNSKMDNSNRFHLNLNPNNGVRPEFNDRAYPTTPSTFPNPINPLFPSGAQGASQGQGQNTQQPYSTGFAPQGYFMNNPYPPTYPQQPPATSYGQTAQPPQAPQAPSASYQNRGPQYHPNDATNGLVHQFSHQNLGGRVSPYGTRQAASSGGQRPRTAGASNQQGAHHTSHLGAMPSQSSQQQNWPEFQPCPSERNPDKYGRTAETNQTKCSGLAETFFKDSVKRARDRNVR
jgi:protein-serine/threonine kinase